MSGKLLDFNTFSQKPLLMRDKLLHHNTKKSEPIRIQEKREEFKNKANEAIKNDGLKWIENFGKITLDIFPMGKMNMDEARESQIKVAISLFGAYLYNIHNKQDKNLYLYTKPLDSLGLTERLQRAILCFLVNPDDILNNSIIYGLIHDIDAYHNPAEGDNEDEGADQQEQIESITDNNQIQNVDSAENSEVEAELSEEEFYKKYGFYYLSMYLEYILRATYENLENGCLYVDMSFLNKVDTNTIS